MAKKQNTTIKQLVAAYNEAAEKLGRKPVKSFKSQAIAEQRTKAILKDAAKGGKAGKAAKGKREPRNVDPLAFLTQDHMPRESSLQGKILAKLQDGGATIEQLDKVATKHLTEAGHDEPTGVRSAVVRRLRAIHAYNRVDVSYAKDGKTIVAKARS